MKLTWRDAATLPFMAAIIALYTAHLGGADGWLVSSTRETAAAIFVLGMFGGCALAGTSEVFRTDRTPAIALYAALASLIGFTALTAGIAAVITGSDVALGILFGATMTLWVLATLRHAVTTPRPPTLSRDTHEVIDQPPVHH